MSDVQSFYFETFRNNGDCEWFGQLWTFRTCHWQISFLVMFFVIFFPCLIFLIFDNKFDSFPLYGFSRTLGHISSMKKGNICYNILEDGLSCRLCVHLTGIGLPEKLRILHNYSWIRIFPWLFFNFFSAYATEVL